MSLIAKIAVHLLVAGERVAYQPGEELPDMPKRHQQELRESGAAIDLDDQERAMESEMAAEHQAGQAFRKARAEVVADQKAAATVAQAAEPAQSSEKPSTPPPGTPVAQGAESKRASKSGTAKK